MYRNQHRTTVHVGTLVIDGKRAGDQFVSECTKEDCGWVGQTRRTWGAADNDGTDHESYMASIENA